METNTEISATSVLSMLETTKEQRTSFVNQVIERIEEGSVSPLTIHLQVKCTEDLLKQLKDNPTYKAAVLEASEKMGKSFTHHNGKFEIKEMGTKYDYSQCNDAEYNALIADKMVLDEKLKQREAFLKNTPPHGIEVRRDDELVTIFPPSKSSTTAVAVTLK